MSAVTLLLVALAPVPAAAPAPAVAAVQPSDAPYEIWQVDQLRVPSDVPEKVLKAIEPAHSIAAVRAVLDRLGVPYTHADAQLVPDRLPEKLRAAILKLPAGEPFVLPEGAFISISVLTQRKLPPDATSAPPRRPAPPTKA